MTGDADRGRGDAGGDPGGGVAELLDDGGDAARPGARGQQQLALAEDPAAQLVDADLVDHPLQAGPELVVPVAEVVEGAQDGLDGGQQLLAGRELLEGLGRVRVGAQAAGHEHPEARLDRRRPGSGRATATTPTSLNMAWPQSVAQPEKLILNLRGRRWA